MGLHHALPSHNLVYRNRSFPFLKKGYGMGAWLAQLVEHETLKKKAMVGTRVMHIYIGNCENTQRYKEKN